MTRGPSDGEQGVPEFARAFIEGGNDFRLSEGSCAECGCRVLTATVQSIAAAAALTRPGWKDALRQGERAAPHLLFDWQPGGSVDALAAAAARLVTEVSGPVESALCPHPAGPPSCWCRPPLPGLLLAFARTHDVDPSRSTLIGGPA